MCHKVQGSIGLDSLTAYSMDWIFTRTADQQWAQLYMCVLKIFVAAKAGVMTSPLQSDLCHFQHPCNWVFA